MTPYEWFVFGSLVVAQNGSFMLFWYLNAKLLYWWLRRVERRRMPEYIDSIPDFTRPVPPKNHWVRDR